jgi:hypothetical protein
MAVMRGRTNVNVIGSGVLSLARWLMWFSMDFVRSLIRLFEYSNLAELEYRSWWGGVRIRKSRPK